MEGSCREPLCPEMMTMASVVAVAVVQLNRANWKKKKKKKVLEFEEEEEP